MLPERLLESSEIEWAAAFSAMGSHQSRHLLAGIPARKWCGRNRNIQESAKPLPTFFDLEDKQSVCADRALHFLVVPLEMRHHELAVVYPVAEGTPRCFPDERRHRARAQPFDRVW